jgi:hypothetical protein
MASTMSAVATINEHEAQQVDSALAFIKRFA